KESIINDFEQPIFEAYPEIELIKTRLYDYGAVYSSMSGSGSTVYGIFTKDNVPVIEFPRHYFQRWV
ncbi:MAG: 4-(cytidine 5'-diphospho)-2-C-methyl-D-erythritol kinase, partial [Gloeobacteraceae cyanobacterium ES-bin-316]|nr:4-(cytidine 5'-diphospho)-2-C-methyl-D-erythritol kinase [Ferruginibacter sp.]